MHCNAKPLVFSYAHCLGEKLTSNAVSQDLCEQLGFKSKSLTEDRAYQRSFPIRSTGKLVLASNLTDRFESVGFSHFWVVFFPPFIRSVAVIFQPLERGTLSIGS